MRERRKESEGQKRRVKKSERDIKETGENRERKREEMKRGEAERERKQE